MSDEFKVGDYVDDDDMLDACVTCQGDDCERYLFDTTMREADEAITKYGWIRLKTQERECYFCCPECAGNYLLENKVMKSPATILQYLMEKKQKEVNNGKTD